MTYNEFIIKAALAATTGIFPDYKYGSNASTHIRVADRAIEYAKILAEKLEKEGIEWDEEPMKINVDSNTPTKRAL